MCTFRHLLSSPPDEEPEEDLSMEQMEEKAKAGDARAQTRVSESIFTQNGPWHCFQSCWLTQSGCEHVSIFGHLEDDLRLSIRHTKILCIAALHLICTTNKVIIAFYLLLVPYQHVQMKKKKKI